MGDTSVWQGPGHLYKREIDNSRARERMSKQWSNGSRGLVFQPFLPLHHSVYCVRARSEVAWISEEKEGAFLPLLLMFRLALPQLPGVQTSHNPGTRDGPGYLLGMICARG